MKQHIKLVFFVLISTFLLMACSADKNETKKSEVVKSTDEVAAEVESSLDMTQLEINTIKPQSNGFVVIELTDTESHSLYGIMNDSFEWVVEPSNKILNLHNYEEGLIAFAIEDTREMKTQVDNELESILWGYMDESGVVIIEPSYRLAGPFSEGHAYVQTVETDRDDLANSRGIIIDKEANEVSEISPASTDLSVIYQVISNNSDFLDNLYDIEFVNGTATYSFGSLMDKETIVFDTDGNVFPFPTIEETPFADFEYIDYSDLYNQSWVNGEDSFFNLYGHKVSWLLLDELKVYNVMYDLQTKETSKTLVLDQKPFRDECLFCTPGLIPVETNSYLRSNELIAFTNEWDIIEEAERSLYAGMLYNLEGKAVLNKPVFINISVASDKDWATFHNDYMYTHFKDNAAEPFVLESSDTIKFTNYKDRYWEQGTEYAVLKTLEGKELVGEDMKIAFDELKETTYLNRKYSPSVAHVEYRASAEDLDLSSGLVNLEDGSFFSLNDLYAQETE